jgi:hypothetical protein
MADFFPGQVLGRGDLDLFLVDVNDNPVNAAVISYALYYVDPGPPEVEVLIGSANRVPVNPSVGEYYASLMIPPSATLGTYRIRWTFKQLVGSANQQVVQQFTVAAPGAINQVSYTNGQRMMMDRLRLLLRDQCVGGEEEVELDVDGERMVVRMDDLWEVLQHNTPGQ